MVTPVEKSIALPVVAKCNALHAHQWGAVWTTARGMACWPINEQQQRLLVRACEEEDCKVLRESALFADMWTEVAATIARQPGKAMHVRLSSTSPKFAEVANGRNPMRVESVDEVIESLVRGPQIHEDLEELGVGVFAICLTPWDDRIARATEYRCFVSNDKLEFAAEYACTTGKEAKDIDLLRAYVHEHKGCMPEPYVALDVAVTDEKQVVFLEFNPVDARLHTCGIDLAKCLSLDLQKRLAVMDDM
jgi:hypothetical protein